MKRRRFLQGIGAAGLLPLVIKTDDACLDTLSLEELVSEYDGSLVMIDDVHLALTYRDSDGVGHIQTFLIDPPFENITMIDHLEIC